MRIHRHLVVTTPACAAAVIALAAADTVSMIEVDGEAAKYWTRWRGPSGQGLVKAGRYTDSWSPTAGVKWKVPVAGRGHSSPIVWGDHIFLTTAREEGAKMSLLAFRRSDGKQLWETAVPSNGVEKIYPKNSHASATAVTDGKLVYASFGGANHRHPTWRNRRCYGDARRLVVTEGIAVRAIWGRRRRSPLSGQRHSERADRSRCENGSRSLPGPTG